MKIIFDKSDNRFKRRVYWWAVMGVAVAVGLFILVAHGTVVEVFREWWDAQVALVKQFPNRGIDTVGQLWKNGYLGVFFRHELFGAVPWLGLLAWLAFLATIRARPRWQLALFFSGTLAAVLIAVQGFYNFRYMFTLQPLLVVFIIFMAWTLSKCWSVRVICFAIIILLTFCSFHVQAGRYMGCLGKLSSPSTADCRPSEFTTYLNRVASRPDRGVLVMGTAWPHYYTRARALNFNHPDILNIVFWAKDDCLARLLAEHGIRYVLSDGASDLNIGTVDSLKDFLNILSARTLLINEGCFSMRCINPELTRMQMESLALQGRNMISDWSFDSLPDCSPWRIYNGTASPEPAQIKYELDAQTGGRCVVLFGENYHLVQDVRNYSGLKGTTVTVFARMKTKVPNKYALQVYDGVGQSQSFHPGNGEWVTLRVTLAVSAEADRLEVRAISAFLTGAREEVRVDDVILVKGKWFMPNDLLE